MAGLRLHLDTNVLICAMSPEHPVRDQIRAWSERSATMATSAMAWSGFLCGPLSTDAVRAWDGLLTDGIIPMDRLIAERASTLFNLTGRRALCLPDCIIAATAITHAARLATLNTEDFGRFQPHGLVLA